MNWQNNSQIVFVNIPGKSILHSHLYLQRSSYSFLFAIYHLMSLQVPLHINFQLLPFFFFLLNRLKRRQKSKEKHKIIPKGHQGRNLFLPPPYYPFTGHANTIPTSAKEDELLLEYCNAYKSYNLKVTLSHYQPETTLLKSYK